MNKGLTEALEYLKKIEQAKTRNALMVSMKTDALILAMMSKNPTEIEKARQELIDAYTANVDSFIETYQSRPNFA